MRFFKIFLAALGLVTGVIGVSIGVKAIQGGFSNPKIGPDSVHFSEKEYFVDSNFELTINAVKSTEEEITEKEITLSFPNTANSTNLSDGRISDGTIIVPKVVTIGVPFQVELAEHNITVDDETFPWIRGGISNLIAKSDNKLASTDTTKIFVDVPVHSVVIETSELENGESQDKFNVNSSFYAKATLRPYFEDNPLSSSAYKYSQTGVGGLNLEYKSVFFNSLEDSYVKMRPVTENTFGLRSAIFDTIEQKEKVKISAFAFDSAKEEEKALGEISEQLKLEDKYIEILSKLSSESVGKEGEIEVDISPLVVGQFSVNTLDIPLKYNELTKIFVNKSVDGLVDSFNLNSQILASDGVAQLTNHFKNIGIALMVGEKPATSEEFSIKAGNEIEKTINGVTYNFFLPSVNSDNLGDSSWEIKTLKQDLSCSMLVVLFNDNQEINASSYVDKDESKGIKNTIFVSVKGKVEKRIFWQNYFDYEKTLYIEKSESGDFFSNYNFANPDFGGATSYVDSSNTFTDVKYFAYLFNRSTNQIVERTENNFSVYDFINASTTVTKLHTGGAQTIDAYEIIDGNLRAKKVLDDKYVIRVVFATLEMEEDKPKIDENGGYVVNLISRDQDNNLQILNFNTKEVMQSLSAELVFDATDSVLSEDETTVAVVHEKDSAFKVLFEVEENQKEIFVRDFNAGKIEVRFLINGQVAQSFMYTQPEFKKEDNAFEIKINIGKIGFSSTGYENFEVELRYIKGDLHSEKQETYKVTTAVIKEDEKTTNAIFEVYDGLIATLMFGDEGESLSDVTSDNPINVKTELSIARTNDNGIRLPSTDSTSSFTHNEQNVKTEIFEENTTTLKVFAYDKYDKKIENTTGMLRLVSADTSSVSVSEMSLNFIKNTENAVKVHIATEGFGVGGKNLISINSLYFTVETNGQVVSIQKNREGAYVDGWTHDNLDLGSNTNNQFEIEDIESDKYSDEITDNKIEINIKGEKDAEYNLITTNVTNLIRILYAMPVATENNLYNVFDLVTITTFYLNSNEEIFDEFIEFKKVSGSDKEIDSFKILKNFGRNAELEFIAQTEIGLSFRVVVSIDAEISGTLAGTLKHDGTISVKDNGLDYHGVFAQHKIEFTISGFKVDISTNYKPLVYDSNTKKVIAILDGSGNNSIEIGADKKSVKIVLYLKDVDKNTLRNLVFVLDSGKNIDENDDYERNLNDFALETLRFYVHPNVKVSIKEDTSLNTSIIKNESGVEVGVEIKMSSTEIDDFVVSESDTINTGGVFYAEGKQKRNEDLKSFKGDGNDKFPYINAYITNFAGTAKVSNDYVKLENNKLTITKQIENRVTLYVMLEHVIGVNVSQLIGYYRVDLVPNIVEDSESGNFVTYDGTRYLQLVSTKGQDSSQKEDAEGTDAIYEFITLADMFEVEEGSGMLSAKIVANIVNNAWWNIAAETITILNKNVRVGDLNIIVTLAGVGSVELPVIILPFKAPFVTYDTISSFEDDEDLGQRNTLANQDLIYSIGKVGIAGAEKYEKLYNENVYNVVNDFQNNISLDFVENKGGINKPSEITFEYIVLNDPKSSIPSSQVASITTDGKLTTYQLGEDAYIIVLFKYSGFEMYYRLKVKATSEMRAFYPYDTESEEKAEYIYHNGSSVISINFKENFNESAPVTKQEIENIYKFDDSTNKYIEVEDSIYPTSRFGLFRKIEIADIGESYEKIDLLNLKSIKVVKIIANDNNVNLSQWSNYVQQDQENAFNYFFKQIGVTYTVVFEIENDKFAKVQYNVVVGQTSPNFEVVKKTEENKDNISTMEEISANHIFKIDSPLKDGSNSKTNDELKDLLLRRVLGGSVLDQTDDLRFHIFEDYDNILSINENNEIETKFTANTIRAKILFYTKHGKVATYEIVVNSKIYVADKTDEENYPEKPSHTMNSGEVFDFSDIVAFVEKETLPLKELTASGWEITFKNLPAGQTLPNFMVEESASKFYIMPVETTQTLQMSVKVTLKTDENDEDDSEFNFDFTLIVEPNIESKYKNSSVAGMREEPVYAGADFELNLFADSGSDNAFFTSENIVLSMEENKIIGKHSSEENFFEYSIQITAENAPDLVEVKEASDKIITFSTKAFAYENVITLKAVVSFQKDNYFIMFESYFSFKLLPDSSVELFYPTVDGNTYESEKIVDTVDEINLSKNNIFRIIEQPRVKITPSASVDVEVDTSNIAQVYIRIVHIAGEKQKLLVDGSALDSTVKYSYSHTFKFGFEQDSGIGFSEVGLEVYVNGVLRAIYKVDIYSEITDVYGIKINQINSVEEENREVFYLGGDAESIFDGVQAIQFIVDQNFRDTVKLEVFKQSGSTQVNLKMSIELKQTDAGFSKTIKKSLETESKDLRDLTTSNIRFRVTRNGIVIPGLKTLSQMKDESIFAITEKDEITLVRRLEITYLGNSITNEAFLDKIKFVEQVQPFKVDTYKISKNELGKKELENNEYEYVSSYNGNVQINFGDQSDNLGTYYYKYKVDFEVEESEFEISVDEKVTRIFDVLGVQKATGGKFVTYGSGGIGQQDKLLQDGKVKIEFSFQQRKGTLGENETDFRLALNPSENYTHTATIQPLTIGGTQNTGFELSAHGSNNGGILIKGILKYTFVGIGDDEDIVIEHYVDITIKHSWSVNTKNNYATGENSIQNPEMIPFDKFTEAETDWLNYILVDNRTANISYGIDIRKANTNDTKNYAIDFVLRPENINFAKNTVDIIEGGKSVAKQISVNRPEFAERKFSVTAEDNYGFKVVFYFKLEPADVIHYQSGLSGTDSVYENDSFVIRHSGSTDIEETADKVILLNKQSLEGDIEVNFTLFENYSGKVLSQITGIDSQNKEFGVIRNLQAFKFLDSHVFSSTSASVRVYLEITLKNDKGEEYVIKTDAFSLYQRYSTGVLSTKVSDGRETNLEKHISVTDKKYGSQLGVPVLLDDKTLMIEDNSFYGFITIEGYNKTSTNKTTHTIVVEQESVKKFISMETEFGISAEEMKNYDFRVLNINDQNQNIKIDFTDNKNVRVTKGDGEKEPENNYVVRIGNSSQVKDIVVEVGKTEPITATDGATFGILGYEKYGNNNTFLLKELKTEKEGVGEEEITKLYLPIELPSDDASYEIVLTNNATPTDSNFKKITINGLSDGYDLIGVYNKINKDEKTDLGTIAGGKIDLSEFYQENDKWVISKYNYTNGTKKYHDEFNFVTDKKLTIGTTIKEKSKDVYETVKVYFNGVDRRIEVTLNKNGKQEFSLLETALKNKNGWQGYTRENFKAEDIELRSSNSISDDDVGKIKQVTYYNDTLEFKMGAISGYGNINFDITKETADGRILTKPLTLQVSDYGKTISFGLSEIFGEVTAIGDEFSLKLTSLPSSITVNEFSVIWPDGEFDLDGEIKVEADFNNLEFGTYTVEVVDGKRSGLIGDGKTDIKIDSKGQYDLFYDEHKKINEVIVTKFYIAEFNDAIHYIKPVNYQVSPYYSSFDSDHMRVIEVYSQSSASDGTTYAAQLNAWAGNISLFDANGKQIIYGNDKTTYLHEKYIKNSSIIKFDFAENYEGDGAEVTDRHIGPDGQLSITFNGNVADMHFNIEVFVALNGKLNENDAENTEWLKIGTITFVFNVKNQFFLEADNYVVSITGQEQTYVKYIEITGDDSTTFSLSNLFGGTEVEIQEASVYKGNDLSTVYLVDKAEENYQVSYENSGLEINTIIKSEKFTKPVIIGNNIAPNGTVSFKLTIGDIEHTGTYTNVGAERLFGGILLSDIKTNGTMFEALIGESTDYEIEVTDGNAKVFWSKLNLTKMNDIGLEFFGDNLSYINKDNKFEPIILASATFKIRKIDVEAVKSVNVSVTAGKTEYYAITQIVQDDNNITQKAQTVVYSITNNDLTQKSMPINLVQIVGSTAFTKFVIVEKIGNVGIKGPALFKTDNNYFKYEVGTLKADSMAIEITAFNESRDYGNNIQIEDISKTFVLEDLLRTVDGTTQAIIVSTNLGKGTDGSVEVDFEAEEKHYNLITIGNRTIYGNHETTYTYEYVTTDREELSFNDGEIKFFIETAGGKLAWHELIESGSSKTGKIYYNLNNVTQEPITDDSIAISGLTDKNIISNIWDGKIYVAGANDIEFGYVTYTALDNKDKEMFFKMAEFRDSDNYVNFGELFKNIDSGKIDKVKFKENDSKIITKHTLLNDYFDSISTGTYEIKEDESLHGYLKIEDSNDIEYTIFDLLIDDRNSVLKGAITLKSFTPDWKEDAGFYLFEYNDVVKMVEITEENKTYNLFDLFGNLIVDKDEVIKISINSQLIVETTASESVDIQLRIVNTNDEEEFIRVSATTKEDSGKQVAVIDFDTVSNKEFFMKLVEAKVIVFQVNELNNVIANSIIEGGNGVVISIIKTLENQD